MCGKTSNVLKTFEVSLRMQKLDPLLPGKIFRIKQYGNGNEPIFPEQLNKVYFRKLLEKHLTPVCDILHVGFSKYEIELILLFRPEQDIPERFRSKLYVPVSNLFNSYAKSINKRYDRQGSLFRKRFERTELLFHHETDTYGTSS